MCLLCDTERGPDGWFTTVMLQGNSHESSLFIQTEALRHVTELLHLQVERSESCTVKKYIQKITEQQKEKHFAVSFLIVLSCFMLLYNTHTHTHWGRLCSYHLPIYQCKTWIYLRNKKNLRSIKIHHRIRVLAINRIFDMKTSCLHTSSANTSGVQSGKLDMFLFWWRSSADVFEKWRLVDVCEVSKPTPSEPKCQSSCQEQIPV